MGRKKRLVLHLHSKWFFLIKEGIKKEEYRAHTLYWMRRLMLHDYDEVEFCQGYPKQGDKGRRLVFRNPHVSIGQGRSEWGAETGVVYYKIKWDDAG